MGPGQWTVDKEDQKGAKKGKEDKTLRNLNIPNPDRGKVSTFASHKISPILGPETKDIKRVISFILPWKDISLWRTEFCNDSTL